MCTFIRSYSSICVLITNQSSKYEISGTIRALYFDILHEEFLFALKLRFHFHSLFNKCFCLTIFCLVQSFSSNLTPVIHLKKNAQKFRHMYRATPLYQNEISNWKIQTKDMERWTSFLPLLLFDPHVVGSGLCICSIQTQSSDFYNFRFASFSAFIAVFNFDNLTTAGCACLLVFSRKLHVKISSHCVWLRSELKKRGKGEGLKSNINFDFGAPFSG